MPRKGRLSPMTSVLVSGMVFLCYIEEVFCDADATEIFRDDFQMLNLENWEVANESNATNALWDPENVFAQNGVLTLRSAMHSQGTNRSRINAGLTTKDFAFKYGQLLIRLKYSHGYDDDSAACSMIMLMPFGNASFPNTSIVFCSDAPTLIIAYQTYAAISGEATKYEQTFISDGDLNLDYHIYRLVRTDELMELYMDDIRLFNLTVPGLENWPEMRIRLLNGLKDGQHPGNLRFMAKGLPPVPSYEFLIDYVIVLQQNRLHSGLTTG
ncbi:uncharacterized protein LOC129596935 [Paramacrobiotus metropolitanus]|uniref:uncharacterized protein LOC129596935 n=1 Tax=Paramacrobiotus metropolitanus TaxID=2943436 RepID=UPI002446422A|nr:uncharacterized protein LOC129596935 [Paramacrobiotus metropolitanus]